MKKAFMLVLILTFLCAVNAGELPCIGSVAVDSINTYTRVDLPYRGDVVRGSIATPEPETKPDATTSPYALTVQERDLIERVVAAEARGQSYRGQMAVAQSIYDRAKQGKMGTTPAEVVLRPRQYAKPYKGAVSDSVKKAVAAVFDNGKRVTDEPLIYFAAPEYSAPSSLKWMRTKKHVITIGCHEFYTD